MGEISVQVSLLSSQITHGRTEVSAMTGSWLTGWEITRQTFLIIFFYLNKLSVARPLPIEKLILVAVRHYAWVCGRSIAGVVGMKPEGVHGGLSVVSVVCCQIEVYETGWSLVQGSSTSCRISLWSKASTIRRPWPTRNCQARKEKCTRYVRKVMRLIRENSFNWRYIYTHLIFFKITSLSINTPLPAVLPRIVARLEVLN